MIRTVPGGNVDPAGGPGSTGPAVASASDVELPELPRRNAAPTTATSAISEIATTQPVLLRPPVTGAGGGTAGGTSREGPASTGEVWTATPGPAGVATSDQLTPFHQRTMPGAPSGSGYQPGVGAGWPGPVTAPP